jgi:hypothetical protein
MEQNQVPQAQQGLQQAEQGLQAQEQLYRELARDNIINPSQPPNNNFSGQPNTSPSQATGQPSNQQAGSQVGGGGSPGLRQSLSGGLAEYDQGKIIFNKNWDKVGEQLSNQSKQVKGYDIPPYFRGRIKEYFERIAKERKKAQEGKAEKK